MYKYFLIVDVSVDEFKQYPNSTSKTIYIIYMPVYFFVFIALIYKNSNRNNLYIRSMTVTLNERSLYLVI